MSEPPAPRYLGDGVYSTYNRDRDMVILTTGDHEESLAIHIIYLEHPVVENMLTWLLEVGLWRRDEIKRRMESGT